MEHSRQDQDHDQDRGPGWPSAGTRADLLADADALGLDLSERLLTDWRRLGLLGAPGRRKSQVHGQDLAEFSAEQRALFQAIARWRHSGAKNALLANLPVYAWLNFDDGWVELRQVRLAMRTAVGADLRRSERAAASAARVLVDQIDINGASVHARARFKREVTDQLRRGRIDQSRLREVVRGVFEPGNLVIRRGPLDAMLDVNAITMSVATRMTAARNLKNISDEQFAQARLRHRADWQTYTRRAELRQQEAGELAELFADLRPSSQAAHAVPTLLLLLGYVLAEQPLNEPGRPS